MAPIALGKPLALSNPRITSIAPSPVGHCINFEALLNKA